jgi:adenine phosphoribosyltransferase
MGDLKPYIRNWLGNKRSDLTHLLAQPHLFPSVVRDLAAPFRDSGVTRVATIDAGGFALGGGVAFALGVGVVLIRKAGRIDWAYETIACTDFSGAEKVLTVASDAVTAADRVIIVDDWSETRGQLFAAIALLERLGATVVGAACLHIGPKARQRHQATRYQLHHLIAY